MHPGEEVGEGLVIAHLPTADAELARVRVALGKQRERDVPVGEPVVRDLLGDDRELSGRLAEMCRERLGEGRAVSSGDDLTR